MPENSGPRIEESGLNVEREEQQAKQVVADVVLDPCPAYRLFAALVGQVLYRAGAMRGKQPRESDGGKDEEGSEPEAEDNKEVIRKTLATPADASSEWARPGRGRDLPAPRVSG